MRPCHALSNAARPRGPASLLDDRRGAVIVLGIVMCMGLVGALWYLIGVGDASLYRQRLDAGADAAAYTTAVYNARGMNVISLLNMVIAATIGVSVIAKGLDFVMGVAYYTARVTCAAAGAADPSITDPSCKIATDAGEKTEKLSKLIKELDDSGDRLVKHLSSAQEDIAKTAPWVGSMESAKVNDVYKPTVEHGAGVSGGMAPEGKSLGLPVEGGDFAVACHNGSLPEPKLVARMTAKRFVEYVKGGTVEEVAKELPDNLCADPEAPRVTRKDLERGDKQVAESEIQKTMQDERIPDEKPEEDLKRSAGSSGKIGVKLVKGATNGGDHFQVYGLTKGDGQKVHKNNVGAALISTEESPEAKQSEDYAMSEAEFYYDQTSEADSEDACLAPSNKCGLEWSGYKYNVLWNMRWRARLRPFRMPQGGGGLNVLNGGLGGAPFAASSQSSEGWQQVNLDLQNKVPGSLADPQRGPVP